MLKKKRLIHLLIGPVLFVLCYLLLPNSIFGTIESKTAISTIIWMAYWWVTGPLDYGITAFLPIVVNAFIPMAKMSNVISNYASETIILLLGASILTVSWEESGLDKRIAAKLLGVIGGNFRTQLAFWFIFAMSLSAILPNVIVCSTITPIAIAMLKYVGEGKIKKSKIGSKLLLAIVYAVGIGGLASPLGGAMNLVTVDYLQQISGQEYMYISWIIRFLPITIILAISNILFLLRDVKKDTSLKHSKEFFLNEYKKMPPMSQEEKWSLILFIASTLLSFSRQLYQGILPELKPAYIFITFAILSFLIVKKDGNRLMIWKNVQGKIGWELIYVFAGGLAVGTLINESGAANIIGNLVNTIGLTGGILTIFIIITITVLLSDITSNTATAAIAIPIVISITQGAGLNPIPYIYISSIGVNLSYMLPTSIRAIPVGYGLETKYMFKEGWKITIIVILLMTLLTYLMLKFWPMFSVI